MKQKNILKTLSFALSITLFSSPSFAISKVDGDWVSLSGKVMDITPETFTLKYGDKTILVEMDDQDWYPETAALLKGDQVTVYGLVDNDLFETAKIEANSVYVKGLNTYFYASPTDEESDLLYPTPVVYTAITTTPEVSASGEVTEIDGREFTLDTGALEIQVDTDEMLYDPTDNVGYQKLEKGMKVYVSGRWDKGFFESDEIKANTLITLNRN